MEPVYYVEIQTPAGKAPCLLLVVGDDFLWYAERLTAPAAASGLSVRLPCPDQGLETWKDCVAVSADYVSLASVWLTQTAQARFTRCWASLNAPPSNLHLTL